MFQGEKVAAFLKKQSSCFLEWNVGSFIQALGDQTQLCSRWVLLWTGHRHVTHYANFDLDSHFDTTQDVSVCKNTESFQNDICFHMGYTFSVLLILFKNMQDDSNIQH